MMSNMMNLTPVYPEIFLACVAMFLLLLGVFKKDNVNATVNSLSSAALVLTAGLVYIVGDNHEVALNGLFVMDSFATFTKMLVLIGSLFAVMMSRQYLKDRKIDRFEYPVVILLATTGMLMMISSGDFLSLYLGLELQSLSLYILAAMDRDRLRSNEAGLKYFVLGALSSGMLLYGVSLIYGFTGTTNFDSLAAIANSGTMESGAIGVIVGLVFVLAGLAFKVSAVPFHMWTPDVYEGAPTPVTAFFAAAPKVAAMALLVRVLFGSFPQWLLEWQQIIIFMSVASMLVGAFVALVQTNIKRLMAYSSIGHVGYALVGVATGTLDGLQAVLIYLAIYMSMTLGTFICILSMRRDGSLTEDIKELAGLSTNHPKMAFALAIFMFSLAGIPLLAGFFGKWYIFLAAVNSGLYVLAIIGVVASVVGAFYYLRIVKIMYFDEPAPKFEAGEGKSLNLMMILTATVNSPLSFLLISPLAILAGNAALSFFQ